jgi:ABC-type branched-subunit amino acid transport system permease subunit
MSQYKHLLGVIAFAALVGLVPVLTDNGFYLKVLFLIGVNYLAAAGLNVLVGYAGQKSLGHAGLFAVGAYTAALLTAKLGWNPWLAFAAAGVMAGVFGVVIALPALRVRGPALAMVTIGFGVVVEKVVSEWQDVFAGQQGIYGVLPLGFGGQPLDARQWVWLVLALGIAAHLMLRFLLRGKYGRAFMAVNTAEVAAESVGVSVYRYKVLAFVISAVTCGFAGALIAQQNQYINSDFITFNLSVFFLLIVLFGGRSVYGPLLGAVVLTLLDALLARWPGVQHFTYGALLLFALYAMPNGLSGALSELLRRLRRQDRRAPGPERAPIAPWRLQTTGAALAGGEVLLRTEGLYKAYGGVVAERRGQDHAAQHPVGHRAAKPGPHRVPRQEHGRPAGAPDLQHGAGAHVPEPQAVCRHVGHRQRQSGPAPACARRLLVVPAGAARGGAGRGAGDGRGTADPAVPGPAGACARAGRQSALRAAAARGAGARAGHAAHAAAARRAGRGPQSAGDGAARRGDPQHPRPGHHDLADRAPHGPGHGHFRPCDRARLRREDRRGRAGCGAGQPARHCRLPGHR